MRKVIASIIVGVILLAGAYSAGAAGKSGGDFRYPATIKCEPPMTRREALNVALIKYHWTEWGTLQLRYACGTKILRGEVKP